MSDTLTDKINRLFKNTSKDANTKINRVIDEFNKQKPNYQLKVNQWSNRIKRNRFDVIMYNPNEILSTNYLFDVDNREQFIEFLNEKSNYDDNFSIEQLRKSDKYGKFLKGVKKNERIAELYLMVLISAYLDENKIPHTLMEFEGKSLHKKLIEFIQEFNGNGIVVYTLGGKAYEDVGIMYFIDGELVGNTLFDTKWSEPDNKAPGSLISTKVFYANIDRPLFYVAVKLINDEWKWVIVNMMEMNFDFTMQDEDFDTRADYQQSNNTFMGSHSLFTNIWGMILDGTHKRVKYKEHLRRGKMGVLKSQLLREIASIRDFDALLFDL